VSKSKKKKKKKKKRLQKIERKKEKEKLFILLSVFIIMNRNLDGTVVWLTLIVIHSTLVRF
jgi:hypothetical protein